MSSYFTQSPSELAEEVYSEYKRYEGYSIFNFQIKKAADYAKRTGDVNPLTYFQKAMKEYQNKPRKK